MQWEGAWIYDEPLEAEENRYRYNSKEYSKGSRLYDYGFRYYSADIGRFTGVDPIADQYAHVSTYNYAENNPVAFIDLWGLQAANPERPKPTTFEKPADLITKTPAIFREGMQEAGRQVSALWERYGYKNDGTNGLTVLGPGGVVTGTIDGEREGGSSNGFLDMAEEGTIFTGWGGLDISKLKSFHYANRKGQEAEKMSTMYNTFFGKTPPEKETPGKDTVRSTEDKFFERHNHMKGTETKEIPKSNIPRS